MYFKDLQNKPFFEPSNEVIQKHSLMEISKEEFDAIVITINTPTPEQVLDQQVAEARQYLSDTDYAVIKLNEALVLGEDITAMKAEYADVLNEREAKRQFIRENT